MSQVAFRLVLGAAIGALFLICSPVFAEDSVRYESQAVLASFDKTTGEPFGQEVLQSPPIDTIAQERANHLPSTNWGYEVDILIMSPKFGSVDFTELNGDNKLARGARFTAGWESDSGYGARTRYSIFRTYGWTDFISFSGPTSMGGFSYRGVPPSSAFSAPLEIVNQSFDIELFKRLPLKGTDILLGAGFRGAELQTAAPIDIDNTLSTYGVSFFSDARRVLRKGKKGELAIVGGGRVSFLTGKWESIRPGTIFEVDTDMTTSEGSLGLEWSQSLGKAVLALRAQYEYQLWSSDVTDDLAFSGGALRSSMSW